MSQLNESLRFLQVTDANSPQTITDFQGFTAINKGTVAGTLTNDKSETYTLAEDGGSLGVSITGKVFKSMTFTAPTGADIQVAYWQ